MIFFLDHDVPMDAAHWLRHRGHEVTLLRDVLPVTATDREALRSGYSCCGANSATARLEKEVRLDPPLSPRCK